MKKLFTVVFTLLLAGSLAFAQATGGPTGASNAPEGGKKTTTTSGKKATKKGHKNIKKTKKSSAPATPAPK